MFPVGTIDLFRLDLLIFIVHDLYFVTYKNSEIIYMDN